MLKNFHKKLLRSAFSFLLVIDKMFTVSALFSHLHQLDIEKSKYLGGSEETTHMVKGLDYALLARYRQKEEKSLDDEMEA